MPPPKPVPRPILIDTDPGIDDAIALLLAIASPELAIRGIVTVAGNVAVGRTTRNALQICDLASRPDIPVHAGCARPLLRPLETAETVHGGDGLADHSLPPPSRTEGGQHGVDFLIERILAEPGLTLCLLGPMTNLAMALIKEPRVARAVGPVIAMAGSFFAGGNSSPALEFNCQVDPHAAHIVLGAGLDLTIVPLDLTHSILTTDQRLAEARNLGGPIGEAASAWLSFYGAHDRRKYGTPGGPLHDPCVIAHLLDPELFAAKRVAIEIELASSLLAGMTVMDWWGTTGRTPNATVLHATNPSETADRFYRLLFERLGRLAQKADGSDRLQR